MAREVRKIVINLNDIRSIERTEALTRAQLRALKAFPSDVLPQVAKAVQVRSIDPLLNRLRIYPPRAVYPIEWKSEKQRRYVMMLLRRQNNIPYQRTGDLARGWRGETTVTRRKDGIRIFVENVAQNQGKRYSRFVGGDIGVGTSARSMARYQEPMQPFHKNTGWQPFAPLVAHYFEDAKKEARERYAARLKRIVAGR
jgi:hypothetical protein